jgi:hypothetical protein
MAAEMPLGLVPPPEGATDDARRMFAYEAVFDGRLVARLVGIASGGEAVRVAAEVYPVHAPEAGEPQWRFYDFPARDDAQRFVDETLVALEYLGCIIGEKRVSRGGPAAASSAAA